MNRRRRNNLYGMEIREEDRRRALPGERKTYNIKQLWQLSHEIINLSACGWKESDIAKILNISPATVSNTLNSELGMEKLSELRGERDEDVKLKAERIRILTDKALDVYDEIFSAEDERMSLSDKGSFAEGFIRHVSGLAAPVKIQKHNINTMLSKEDIEKIAQRGIESMREAGLLHDE